MELYAKITETNSYPIDEKQPNTPSLNITEDRLKKNP